MFPGFHDGAPYLQVAAELRQKCDWGTSLQVRVQILLKLRWHHSSKISEDPWCNIDFTKHVHLLRKKGGEESAKHQGRFASPIMGPS